MSPTIVDTVIAMFVDDWILHAMLLPTNMARNDFTTETVQKLEILIQTLQNFDFEQLHIGQRRETEEEKSN